MPIIWCLTSNRTKKAYKAIWQHLKENFPGFNPAIASCDFEEALRFSLEEEFEGIQIIPCYFHYTQVKLYLAL